jgi:hypothetical protein
MGDQTSNHLDKVAAGLVKFLLLADPIGNLGGILAPFIHYSILIEITCRENDLSIAAIATVDLTSLTILRIQLI